MASVSHFQKFLSLIDPKKDASLFALYNYLKNYHLPQDEFSEKTINTFFLRSLRFEHWRKNKTELHAKVIEAVQAFSHQSAKPFLFIDILSLDHMELLELKNEQDLCDVIQLFLIESNRSKDKVRLKIKPIEEKRILSLQVTPKNEIKVHIFSPFVFVKKGKLQPIYPLTSLIYTSQVDLHPNKDQELEVSPHHFARFCSVDQLWQGRILRGYTHQNFSQFKCSQLMDQFDIAQKIKYVESHYVNVNSDPDYQNIVNLLEKSIQLVDHDVEHSMEIAQINMKKGQIALNQLFPNDKHLQLLLTNLEYSIMKKSNSIDKSWTINQNQKKPLGLSLN